MQSSDVIKSMFIIVCVINVLYNSITITTHNIITVAYIKKVFYFAKVCYHVVMRNIN